MRNPIAARGRAGAHLLLCFVTAFALGAARSRRAASSGDMVPSKSGAGAAGAIRRVQTIPLPGVEGRLDHLAIDEAGKRLFVAALGNNSVEVVDLASGARLRTITGLHAPQAVLFVPELGRLFVSNGEGGALDVFDAATLRKSGSIALGEDADNMRYDPRTRTLLVGAGEGALEMLDAAGGKAIASVPLQAHPEAFEIEPGGPRVFVNVPGVHEIAVVDRESAKVVATWRLEEAQNFPMALEEASRRLFVACRRPSRLLVFDAASGALAGSASIDGDADDVFVDAARGRIYVSCGAGFLDVVERANDGRFRAAERVDTARGARTSLFDPASGRLYVAVPHEGAQRAEIQVYDVGS